MGEGLFQPSHLVLIMMLALLLFGGDKLAESGAALGKSVREFRRTLREDGDAPHGSARFCSQCGAPASEVDRFCTACGAQRGAPQIAATSSAAPSDRPLG